MFTEQALMTLRCQIRLMAEARFIDEHKKEHECYSFLQVIVKRCEMDDNCATYVNDASIYLWIYLKKKNTFNIYVYFILSNEFKSLYF